MSKDKQGKLGIYREVTTEDGEITLWSEAFDENCHSTRGARGETLEVYIQGCQVVEKARQNGVVRILEVGFGTGLGMRLTTEILRREVPEAEVWFLSLELDPALVEWARPKIPGLRYGRPYETPWGRHFVAHDRLHSLAVVLGDARVTLKEALSDPLLGEFFPVDCIYQDAFSPRKNPELWTPEWFGALKKAAAPGAVLSTYSASKGARRAMLEAGLKVEDRPGFAGKNSSTRATFEGS